MRKRLSSKLLSVILTIAICATTVFGCLITVNADNSCYTFSVAEVSDDLTEATLDVTFTAPESLPNGFAAGAFTLKEVNADAADCLTLKSVTADGGMNVTVEGEYVLFDGSATSTLTMELTFGFSNGIATKGKNYQVQLSEVELAYNDAEYYVETVEGAIAKISTACEHVISVVGDPIEIDEANNYSVYASSVCTLCGETFGKQLVPSAEKLGGNAESEGTIDLLEFSDSLITNGSTSKYFDSNVADNGETGADWDNAIIIDSAEEFVYLCKGDSTGYTAGKYFKVADGIKGFDLSNGTLNLNGTLEDNLAIVKGSGKNHAGSSNVAFQGNFDGNGVTVYGAWTNHTQVSPQAGLFSYAKGDVTIKNVNVKFASFTATSVAGGIVGQHQGDGTNTLTIENCSVTDSEIVSTGTAWGQGTGAIVGYMNNCSSWKEADKGVDGNGDGDMVDTIYVNGVLNIKNCYVNLDADYFKSGMASDNQALHGGVAGFLNTNAMKVENCVVIGITPYATTTNASNNNVQHTGLETHFTNVYTDQPAGSAVYIGGTLGNRNFTNRVTQVAVKGSAAVVAMPNLDWGTTWVMDGTDTYPRLALPGETFDTIYWDGANTKTAPSVGSGTKDDPYIISTVAEFAYISGQARDNYAITDGKYYKIADGIKSIVMQPYAYGNDIKALDSAAATKAYFESNAANMKQWLYYAWEGSTFCGSIDFNGATVYGIYQVSASNAGLFSNIDAGAAFHNLAIKNSYMVSQSSGANYQVGAIAAVTNGAGYGKATTGFIWAKNCTIANNYMYCNATLSSAGNGGNTRAGVMFGASSDIMYVDNCLVYGNDATCVDGSNMPLYSQANNATLVSAAPAIPDGLEVVDDGAETPRYYNMTRNSIFLGFNPFDLTQGFGSRFNDLKGYINCYTDADVETDTDANGKTVLQHFYVDSSEPYLTQINVSEITGSAAQTNMPNLTWGTDWYCGAYGELPTLAVFATTGVNETSTAAHALYGSSVTYNDDGTFDFNLHFAPQFEGIKATLYVGTYDATEFYKLESTESSYRSELGEGALMFTLPNIPARLIDKVWLPTIVVEGGVNTEWGLTQPVALVDNAKGVLEGDYDTADKKVSAALINYGTTAKNALSITKNDYDPGTGDLLEFGDYLKEMGSTSTWYDTVLADNGETGTSWDDAIIIDSAEEFVYLAKASGDDTAGKYYKVADGMAIFDLSRGDLDYTKGLAANLDKIKAGGKNHAGGTPGFQGHFDGNGVTIYGAWTNHNEGHVSAYTGLFSCTKNTVTIKNVNVKLAAFTATTGVGGIIGYHKADELCTVTVENCSITDSYLEAQNSAAYGGGVGYIIGSAMSADALRENNTTDYNGDGDMTDTIYRNVEYNVKNCYVELDEQYIVSPAEDGVEDSGERMCHGGVVSMSGSNAVMVSNCVVIGVKPYATSESTAYNDVQHTGHANNFSNVYTDQEVSTETFVGGTTGKTQDLTTVMTQLTTEQLTGAAAKANMPSLDWVNTWTTTNGYPTFINKDYVAPASGVTIYWDGTVATGFSDDSTGTKDDPIIINTAAELAYLVKADGNSAAADPTTKITVTAFSDGSPKYFKIADGISNIVLQPESKADGIMTLGSAAEVKSHFESGSFTEWVEVGWETSTFCGNFDGNGATVYGLYSVSASNAGLFSTVEGGATIKNIALKNSYLTSTATNYQVGAIVPVASGTGYGFKREGVIWVNGCTVANCYMYNACTSWERSGVIAGGCANDVIMIDNCITYGNDATYGDGVKMALVGVGNNDLEEALTKPAELTSYILNSGYICNSVRNSIILDCDVMNTKGGISYRRNGPNCYVNVYTNASSGTVTLSNGSWTYEDASIKAINAADVKGNSATAIVNAFNAAPIAETVWYVGATGDYPGFEPAGIMPSGFQTALDSIAFETVDTIGGGTQYHSNGTMAFGVYQTALSLKANPYITFAFAFYGDHEDSEYSYRLNRDKIKIRFTYTENGELVTSNEISVPGYVEGQTLNEAGWTNTEKNGRYHTYKAEDIPVEALADGIKVEASYNGGTWADFGTFSVEGLGVQFENASKVTPCDYYATRVEATKALLFYVQAIQARYGA